MVIIHVVGLVVGGRTTYSQPFVHTYEGIYIYLGLGPRTKLPSNRIWTVGFLRQCHKSEYD